MFKSINKERIKEMKSTGKLNIIIGAILLITASLAFAQKTDPNQLLKNVDDVLYAPKDQDYKVKLVLIDTKGGTKEREMTMLQKGSDKRVVKFLSPADQKGIAFLSLPNDIMYLYMPAFSKTRRIASHVKNTNFAGTDFTYEDMEAIRYSEKWVPELVSSDDNTFILQLTPKAAGLSDYSKLLLTVGADNFYPTRIEHFSKSGKLCKIMTRSGIKQMGGYWVCMETEMEDIKAKHKTKMIITDMKLDSGLSDDKFTERFLTR